MPRTHYHFAAYILKTVAKSCTGEEIRVAGGCSDELNAYGRAIPVIRGMAFGGYNGEILVEVRAMKTDAHGKDVTLRVVPEMSQYYKIENQVWHPLDKNGNVVRG